MNKKNSGIFIVGTDTGIGKTYVSVSIIKQLKEAGFDVGVCKPFASGSGEDAFKLKKAAGVKDGIGLINPLYFKYPLAPECSLELEKRRVNLGKALSAIRILLAKHDFLLVEGIGGLMVPLAGKLMLADFIKKTALGVLVVSGCKLGTINHTILTCEALKRRNIKTLGIIMNGYNPRNRTAVLSARSIVKHTGLPILATVAKNGSVKPNIGGRLLKALTGSSGGGQ